MTPPRPPPGPWARLGLYWLGLAIGAAGMSIIFAQIGPIESDDPALKLKHLYALGGIFLVLFGVALSKQMKD
jgi:hypothetical protein